MQCSVSVLFNEPKLLKFAAAAAAPFAAAGFSALQRAEIAEMQREQRVDRFVRDVSVLFNEPKLLKFTGHQGARETVEMFQCSSTSRNC